METKITTAPLPPRLLTLRGVAAYLSRSRTQLYKSGLLLRLPAVRLMPGADALYDVRDVDSLIEELKERKGGAA